VKKIPTIFERDWNGDRSRVVDQPHALCGWVFAGEGMPHQKLDGTSCLFQDGKLWKRREVKGDHSSIPDFMIADHDEEAGKTVGWVPVGDGPEDKWHRTAFSGHLREGHTYELVGPKVQGGIEGYPEHRLIDHVETLTFDIPRHQRTFDGLREWLAGRDIEGLVFHHPDGRMAKIKLRDFGLKRTRMAA
jgi:hypothetical protein